MFCSPDSPLGFRLPLSATKGRRRRCAHMAGKSHSRLKVYATHIGLHEWLVAAPSQKAALKAWDVRENLFATGAAKVVTDPKAVKLAMTAPGDPVARDENGAAAKATRRYGQQVLAYPSRWCFRDPDRRSRPNRRSSRLIARSWSEPRRRWRSSTGV